jgi:hypothetical protein
MVRRFLLSGAVLLFLLLLIPACGSQGDSGKGVKMPPDQPPPEPRAGGKPG